MNKLTGKQVESKWAYGPVHGQGKVVAYYDVPSVVIRRDDGTEYSWPADLVREVTSYLTEAEDFLRSCPITPTRQQLADFLEKRDKKNKSEASWVPEHPCDEVLAAPVDAQGAGSPIREFNVITNRGREDAYLVTVTVRARETTSSEIEDFIRRAIKFRVNEQEPDGYAHVYGDVIRFNEGQEVNGGMPNAVIPLYFGPRKECKA